MLPASSMHMHAMLEARQLHLKLEGSTSDVTSVDASDAQAPADASLSELLADLSRRPVNRICNNPECVTRAILW